MRSIRTARFKYIRRFDGRDRPVLPNCDDSPSKTLLAKHNWKERSEDQEMLFDLVFDPNEADNLVHGDRAPEVLAQLRHSLTDWMTQTGDPLLRGSVPVPAGGETTEVDAYSPTEKLSVSTTS